MLNKFEFQTCALLYGGKGGVGGRGGVGGDNSTHYRRWIREASAPARARSVNTYARP